MKERRQNFLKVIHGDFDDIEKKAEDFFLYLFKEDFRIYNTRYHVHDEKVDIFIQYFPS